MARRLPTPLIALCVTAFLVGAAWAFVTPPFQAPDENQHFAYADFVARTGQLPGISGRPPFSTEQQRAGLASNSDQTAGRLAAKPSWNPADEERWERTDQELGEAARRNGGGEIPASRNPRLYYLADSLLIEPALGATIHTRLTWARLGSVAFTVLLVVFAWLLAGEVFARDRSAQFLAAGTAGLLPMLQFVSSSVTPDAALYATWAAFFWLGARVLLRGLTMRRAVGVVAVVAVACFVKKTSFALVPGAVFLLGAGLWRIRPLGGRRTLRAIAAGIAVLGALGAWWFADRQSNPATAGTGGPLVLDDFASYLWQYYLPQLPGQGEYPFPHFYGDVPFYEVVVKGVLGAFGWTEVRYPGAAYPVLAALLLAVAVAAVVVLVRARRRVDLALVGLFAITAGALWAGVQWTDYEMLKDSNFSSGFNQGRYLFPLAAVGGLAAATAARLVPAVRRGALAAGTVTALVVWNVWALGTVAWRFYA